MEDEQVELRFVLRAGGSGSRTGSGPVRDLLSVAVSRAKPTPAARQLALAIHFDDLLERGEAKDYAGLARLACLSRERVSQIMRLRWLAPDLQQQILEGACIRAGELRKVTTTLSWSSQRRTWVTLMQQRTELRAPLERTVTSSCGPGCVCPGD